MSCCVRTAPLNIKQSERLAEKLKSLADPVRLRLLSIVATAHTGEVCACDFLGKLEKSQPTISHHPSQLVKAGILSRKQRGKWAWYRLADGLCDVREALGEGCC